MEHDEFDPRLSSLLEHEKGLIDLPAARREAMFSRITSAIPTAVTPMTPQTPAPSAPNAAEDATPAGEVRRNSVAGSMGARVLKASAWMALGVVIGAAGQAWRSSRHQSSASSTHHADLESAASVRGSVDLPPQPSAASDRASALPVASGSSTSGRSDTTASTSSKPTVVPSLGGASSAAASTVPGEIHSTLAQERTLVERGRAAIARGDGAAASDALAEHRKNFPSGRLSEERDALGVQALLLQGSTDAARRSAREFEERYPKSVFLPRVRSLVSKTAPEP